MVGSHSVTIGGGDFFSRPIGRVSRYRRKAIFEGKQRLFPLGSSW